MPFIKTDNIVVPTSGTVSFIPKARKPVITTWQLTAVGAGEVTFSPTVMGFTEHEGYTVQNKTINVDLMDVDEWVITESGNGEATCRVIQIYSESPVL